jgi:hypothetical protein
MIISLIVFLGIILLGITGIVAGIAYAIKKGFN